jgi:hypothetical protein
MKSRFLLAGCLAVSLICLGGCTSYRVRPDVASITIPKSPSPIPAKVGITSAEQKLTGGFSDIVQDFKKQLDESGLFQEVYYPVRPTDQLDGGITLKINAQFNMDKAAFAKAFFTGFFMFLPTSFVVYDHHYHAECTLEVLRDGRLLKTYKGDGTVLASHKLFAPADKLEAEGTAAASKALAANLIGQLVTDRDFLQKQLGTSKPVASQ